MRKISIIILLFFIVFISLQIFFSKEKEFKESYNFAIAKIEPLYETMTNIDTTKYLPEYIENSCLHDLLPN